MEQQRRHKIELALISQVQVYTDRLVVKQKVQGNSYFEFEPRNNYGDASDLILCDSVRLSTCPKQIFILISRLINPVTHTKLHNFYLQPIPFNNSPFAGVCASCRVYHSILHVLHHRPTHRQRLGRLPFDHFCLGDDSRHRWVGEKVLNSKKFAFRLAVFAFNRELLNIVLSRIRPGTTVTHSLSSRPISTSMKL